MTSQLDTFEAELLQELRSTVATRSQQHRYPKAHSPRRFIRRTGLAAGVAAAAAVATVVVLPGVLADPAYAVTNGPQGTIEVQVNRLEDAAGLQHALDQHGVKANVQYLGFKKKCTSGRYQDAHSAPDSSTMFSVGSDGITARIDRRDVAHGETVVIAASRIPNGFAAEVGIAKGPVRACHPIPLSPADFPH